MVQIERKRSELCPKVDGAAQSGCPGVYGAFFDFTVTRMPLARARWQGERLGFGPRWMKCILGVNAGSKVTHLAD